MTQPTELQMNTTLALAIEGALPAIRQLAAQMADESEEARLLRDRLAHGGALKEADITLALSVLAQAVAAQQE